MAVVFSSQIQVLEYGSLPAHALQVSSSTLFDKRFKINFALQ